MKHIGFAGRLVVVGHGSIARGTLPLLLRHVDMAPSQVTILTADDDADGLGVASAAEAGVERRVEPLTPGNLRSVLAPLVGPGDFVLNLSVDVSSTAVVELCQDLGARYLDTCIEPWAGGYTDTSLSPSLRSNYALREAALALKRRRPGGPTAVLAHGANPGLVSHLLKRALLAVAADTGQAGPPPAGRDGWARLAQRLGVRAIHVAERDTQAAAAPRRRGEFVNTWSVAGFVGEGLQPAELGWGTHERALPPDGAHHEFGCGAAIYLNRPGAGTRVRSWTPNEGPFHGFLITHNESISIADHLTVRDGGAVAYRPTVHYAYHPCDDAVLSMHELAGKAWHPPPRYRLMTDEIVSGMDELGVLLTGHARNAYWYGSQLTVDEARRLAPHNNATSLQVAASVLGGVVWALENGAAGIVEAEEMDAERILAIAEPYLGRLVGAYSDWTPLAGRGELYPEDVDRDDPWQFRNVRVT